MSFRSLSRCSTGAAILEFALLAPLFIAMLFGLIEFGRAYWTRQTLKEVAFHTARCIAIDDACATQQQRVAFAVARAGDYSILVAPSEVSAASGVTCRGQASSHEVAISIPFSSPIAGFGFFTRSSRSKCMLPDIFWRVR